MSKIVPYHFDGASIRALEIDGEPHFVGKDVAEALGYVRPNDALQQHCKGAAKHRPLPTGGGIQQMRVINEPDMLRLIVNSTLPAAERFERWVFEEVLPSIRKTGSYTAKKPGSPLRATSEAAKAFPALVRCARLLGCDKNAAAISANQAIYAMTDINLMQQLGRTHLVAQEQDSQWYTPTELGKEIGTSARGMNLLLAEAGLQVKIGEKWEHTEAGRDFCRMFDTGKKHGSGVPVTQLKWSRNVLPMLGESRDAA
ncbi:Bro-N domain-containing protein [uncultured Xylophilus sp.]|uniref:BRO-N domain-containing protein n=1 Tax=uncultured Xylophilus sp. TaxID=296832 RepID=UPI0025F6EFA3|nr:Bro-N domain-containing protein [uncultured Xylophilus sp.]